jgi:signal transduction histidine kinase
MEKSVRIGIVEDDILAAQVLQLHLQQFGYSVFGSYAKGEDLLEQLGNEAAYPDLILMDIRLDGALTGVETAELIQKIRPIPVIFLTGYDNEQIFQQSEKIGAFGYLQKPVDTKQLLASIKMALSSFKNETNIKENLHFAVSVLSLLGDAVFVLNKETFHIVYKNPAGKDLLAMFSLPLDDATVLNRFQFKRFSTNSHIQIGDFSASDTDTSEIKRIIAKANNITRFLEVSLSPNPETNDLILVVRDITSLIEQEENFQALSLRLRELHHSFVNMQESERLLIAREIHDELAQYLVRIKMDLFSLKNAVSNQVEASKTVENSIQVLNETVKRVKLIAKSLRPPLLDEFGLNEALKSYLEELIARNETTFIHFSFADLPDSLDADWSLDVFRVMQESITNCFKHAKATEIEVNSRIESDVFILSIRDNGNGFTGGKVPENSWGVLGMKERALKWGGTLTISPATPHGTLVNLSLPLP